MPPLISKTRFLEGLQCPKLLWHRYNRKEAFPPLDPSTRAIFEQGTEVGSFARKLYPSGRPIDAKPWEFPLIDSMSRSALGRRLPLFEAGFMHRGAFARFDVLEPAGSAEWNLIEVKSSTEVKEVNLDDIAFQYFVADGAGLRIRSCLLCHIDASYVRRGEVDPAGLFAFADVTPEVLGRQAHISRDLEAMRTTVARRSSPDIPIGPHCSRPYDCPLTEMCWGFLPEHNVFTLVRSRKSFDWYSAGITEIGRIPPGEELSDAQRIQVDAVRAGQPHIDRERIADFLAGLRYPLCLLDFETFSTAIPLFDNLRPYQRVPFQFSVHTIVSQGADPQHAGFLADGGSDPRPEAAKTLRNFMGDRGSVVCYNASFETGLLRELGDAVPEAKGWTEGVIERIADLIVPFRSFAYYHPDQKGSVSLKVVLPALTGKSYDGMAIADGDTASREYLRVTYGGASAADRSAVRRQLEEYCHRDTAAMVWIIDSLRALI